MNNEPADEQQAAVTTIESGKNMIMDYPKILTNQADPSKVNWELTVKEFANERLPFDVIGVRDPRYREFCEDMAHQSDMRFSLSADCRKAYFRLNDSE